MSDKQSSSRKPNTVTQNGVRYACVQILRKWGSGNSPDKVSDHHLSDLIAREAAKQELSSRDRAFVQATTLGVARNLTLLDHWIDELRDGKISPEVRDILRVGLLQLLILDHPPHAAVNEAVELAGQARGLVNAILRRAQREASSLNSEDVLNELSVEVALSHPGFLLQRWADEYGEETAIEIAEWNQSPAPMYGRTGRLMEEDDSVEGEAIDGVPGFFRFKDLPRELLAAGKVYAQDPSTALAPNLLAPSPGHRILDACAAPGGKTDLLSILAEDSAEIVATDPSEKRLVILRDNLERLGTPGVVVHQHKWAAGESDSAIPDWAEAGFDRILVDAPCSNTGVLRRRVDARWRLSPSEFERLPREQLSILLDVTDFLRPGGRIVYSTCSIDKVENRDVVDQLLRERDDLILIEDCSSLPSRDGFDGAYAALIERKA